MIWPTTMSAKLSFIAVFTQLIVNGVGLECIICFTFIFQIRPVNCLAREIMRERHYAYKLHQNDS